MPQLATRQLNSSPGKLTLLLFICCALLALPPIALVQQKKFPIEKEGLLRALRRRALTSAELIKEIRSRGVNFQLTADAEKELRQTGKYLGTKGVEDLIQTVRGAYTPITPSIVEPNNEPLKEEEPAAKDAVGNSSPFAIPIIKSISPTNPIATGFQIVTFHGSNFVPGGTVRIMKTGGPTFQVGPSQVVGFSPTSMSVGVTFYGGPGEYIAQVLSPTGVLSNPFRFIVNPPSSDAKNDEHERPIPNSILEKKWDITVEKITIQSMFVHVDLDVETTPRPVSENRVNLQSHLDLQTGNKKSVRLISDDQMVDQQVTSGMRRLSFVYKPENPNDVLGQDLDFLKSIEKLKVNYSAIFRSLGFATNRAHTIVNVTVFVNDIKVGSLMPPGVLTSSQGSLTVSRLFTAAPQTYYSSLEIRANDSPYALPNTPPEQVPIIHWLRPYPLLLKQGIQRITVLGLNFQKGLTVSLSSLDDGLYILDESQIHDITPTSFVIEYDFNNEEGIYFIRVNNPNGARSNTFPFPLMRNYIRVGKITDLL